LFSNDENTLYTTEDHQVKRTSEAVETKNKMYPLKEDINFSKNKSTSRKNLRKGASPDIKRVKHKGMKVSKTSSLYQTGKTIVFQ